MRFGFVLILVLSQCAAMSAQGGAWLREKGAGFSSVSFTTTYFGDNAISSYLEYGVRDDLTLGADIAFYTSRNGQQSGYGTVFMRRPIGPNNGPNRWAYELGVGTAWVGDLMLPHVKTGVSWGRGIEFKDKNGWMAVDTSVVWDINNGLHLTKLDGTAGLNFAEITTGMVQVYFAHLDGELYGTVAPSVLFKPRKVNFRIQIGAEIPVRNVSDAALKLGIWRKF